MLALNAHQEYSLQPIDGGGYTLSQLGRRCTFSAPASTKGVAKLYTVSHEATLLYVGITQQRIGTRLKYGFRAEGKSGYHGYKWKLLRHEIRLDIWTARLLDGSAKLRDLETVEAEVAFLCRQQSGHWPKFQHEIHFYQSNEHHRAAAKTVYEHAVRVA
jgi:hypothetical protein